MTKRQIFVAGILIFGVLAYTGVSQAAGRYSAKSLKGVYGFSGSGTLGTTPAAVVGLNTFDGVIGCNITAKINLGGTVEQVTTATCTYTVNPDGTGALDVTFNEAPFNLPFHSDFVIVDHGKELHAVLSDAAGLTVATSLSKRQTAAPNE